MMQVLIYYCDFVVNIMLGFNDIMEVKDVFMNGIVLMVIYFIYIFLVVIKEGDLKNVGFVVLIEKNFVVYGMLILLIIIVG